MLAPPNILVEQTLGFKHRNRRRPKWRFLPLEMKAIVGSKRFKHPGMVLTCFCWMGRMGPITGWIVAASTTWNFLAFEPAVSPSRWLPRDSIVINA